MFVLGAGFSAPFDVPTMKPFLQSFRRVAERKYPELCGTLIQHFSKLQSDSDIEALLSSFGSAQDILDSLPPNTPMSEELSRWQNESLVLQAHLVSYIIELCERFNQELALKILSPLLTSLHDSSIISEIHLATTNYDRIIEYVCESISVSISDGFSESEIKLVAPWNGNFNGKIRLYKLHGSVTYYVDRAASAEPTFLRLDRGYPLPSPDFRLTKEGHALEPLMVLPTLEKETLGDPYGQLNHRFTETMSRAKIVVAIGTSLRDNYLVSAINYNSDRVVVLLIDTDPGSAKARIPHVQCVTLRANAADFFAVSTDRLIKLFEKCVGDVEILAVRKIVEDFAKDETIKIAQRISLTEKQRDALTVISADSNETNVLRALQSLHGITDSGVIEAVAFRCKAENSDMVRKAAAGCLGLSESDAAVSALNKISTEDLSADVRLEGYLALAGLGTEEALKGLELARHRWPEDTYFETMPVTR